MRLIDADAEIAKIEQEIQRINEKIKRLEDRMIQEPNNSIHVFTETIKQCHRNIKDCKREIRVLQQYQTAYDVDKVVEQINVIMDDESIRYCGQAVQRAVKVVKAGGVNE